MDPEDDDNEARRKAAGRTERVTSPGIPGLRLPPRVTVLSQDPEKTPPHSPMAHRARQATQRGLQPVAPRPAVEPPRSLSPVPSERSPFPAPAPASLIPAPWDDTTENRVAAVKAGYRTAYVPSSPPPQPGYAEPAWWRSASGMVKVIGATAAALIGSTTAITAIIGALHQPPAPSAPTVSVDPCPPTVPPLQRSAFCVRLDQMQQAANTASADAADAKVRSDRAERHADQIEERIPKIKGLPKP